MKVWAFTAAVLVAGAAWGAPEAELSRVDALTNERRYVEALAEVDALLGRQPDDPTLRAYRILLARLEKLGSTTNPPPVAPTRPLSAREQLDLKTLRTIQADLADARQDPSRESDAKRFATELLARSDLLRTRLADEVDLWAARADAAMLLGREDEGVAAAQRLVALGAVDAGDASFEEILVRLNRRGWLPATAGNAPATRPAVANVGAPGVSAFGVSVANARRIVFLCDASGSMLGTLQAMAAKGLASAVDGLRQDQGFGIVFFQNDEPSSLRRATLMPATPENKRLASKFLSSIEMKGSTSPLPALKEAFLARPDVIYIVTDGVFDDPKQVVTDLARLNVGRRTKVNIIQLVATAPDNLAAKPIIDEATRVLSRIAADNGGEYRLVRPADVP